MEELIDLIATDGAAADISNMIKDILYTKAAEKIDSARPYVAASMFGDENDGEEQDYTEDQE